MKVIEKIRAKKGIVRGVMYGRYSTDMQREESIEAQVRAMRQFAEQNNIVIVGEYYDRAKSGTKSDREEFNRMLKESGKGRFDLLLVHKLDRFARNRSDSMACRLQLKRNGVSVIASAQPFDSDTPEGMMMEAMLEAMAEYYSKNLANEVEKGKRENALKGLHCGGKPPLGYDVDRNTMKLVINEQEAKAVRLIFDIALEGGGYGDMIKALRMKGFKTKQGNDFGHNSLHSVLKNEKYTGTFIYSKSAAKDFDGKRNGHAVKSDDEIIRVENAVPAIITHEEFAQVQQIMKARSKTKGKNKAKEIYLLSGKVTCGECGSVYTGHRRPENHNHPKYVSYKCSRKNKRIQCPNGEIRREALETHVLEKLSQLVFNDSIIPDIIGGYNEYAAQRDSASLIELNEIRGRIDALDKEIGNIVTAIAQTGSLALADHLKVCENEKAELDGQLFMVQEELQMNRICKDDIVKAFRHARRLLKNKTLPNLQQIIDTFVDTVVLYKDHIEIVFNVGFDATSMKREIPHCVPDDGIHNTVFSTPPRDVIIGGELG